MRIRPGTSHLAVAALGALALLISQPADAQVFYRYGSGFGPGFAPDFGVRPMRIAPAPLPPDDIIDILHEDYGFRRVGRPQFAGRVYVVDGVDRRGAVVRAYVDATLGRLIEVDILRGATARPPGQRLPGPNLARLPDDQEPQRLAPMPPRRPIETRPAETRSPDTRQPRQAARPVEAAPGSATRPLVESVAPPSAPTTIVPLAREPRIVNPAEVRVPNEADRAPPLARPPAAPGTTPQAVAPQRMPAAPPRAVPGTGPGASTVAPAPLDDAVRRPSGPASSTVPAAPLL